MHVFKLTIAAMAAAIAAGCGGGDGGKSVNESAKPRLAIQITSTQDFPGTYGSVGAYEKVSGTISGELDPKDARNRIIQDLELAPVNARGMVEYSTDFVLLKPKNMSKASGVLRYDAPNRGNILTMPNPSSTPSDAVYMERGYVMLYAAWQGDVPKSSAERLTAKVPVAINTDGSSITGTYRTELVPGTATSTMGLPGGVFNGTMLPYVPASLDNTAPGYSLTRRINETDKRELIPASDWKFADCTSRAPFPGIADAGKVCMKDGFDPLYLYELVYVAKDPKVMGVGLAALRDAVHFFRSTEKDSNGSPNPLAGRIKYTLGQGTSQSGNAMKTFLHLGFNQATDGSRVFDGMYAHVAARQTNVNTRFAVPGGGGGLRTDHTAFGQTAPRGLDKSYVDDISGREGGVMRRCSESNTCPKFFLGLSGTEFWQLQGSPVLTNTQGSRDIAQPDNVRIYYYSSTQHGGAGGESSISYVPSRNVYPAGTVVHFNDTFRALFLTLEDWVAKGTEPPASQTPLLADGTLVKPGSVQFPAMQGVQWKSGTGLSAIPAFNYLARYNNYELLEFGPQYRPEDESGIASILPPRQTGRQYPILVPQVDPRTGLTIAGIHSVEALAPLGTSIEFNYVASDKIVDLSNLTGSYIPFHKTRAQRIAAGDTRVSLEELYVNQDGYVQAVSAAARGLVEKRLLLQRDAELIIEKARNSAIFE
ncbi:alpha/beta hydrolase domain-containing protein [Comamonas testosteroni]|uniref:alpha/beta hydrolase domain-containing protein n=1 Tax=Comamonas testosteroni TaxID=285 RepID=UPI00389A9F31